MSDPAAAQNPPLVPVGVDLGSLHARVAAGEAVDPFAAAAPKGAVGGGDATTLPPLPGVVRNAQGGRYTLAASAAEFRADHGGDDAVENGKKDEGGEGENFVFGEAARQSLQRARKPLERSLVRHMSSVGLDDDDDDENEAKKEEDVDEIKAEADSARSASSAFFAHLSRLVCDSSSVRPSQLRVVLNAPAGADAKVVRGALEATERGLAEAVKEEEMADKAAGKKKRKKKKGEDDDGRRVVGVLSDPAAVAVTHGLTGAGGLGSISLDAPGGSGDPGPRKWSHALVVDWGASALTLSHLTNLGGNSGAVHLSHTIRNASCSGLSLSSLLVKHCASQFERRNRLPSGEVLLAKRSRGRLERACEDALRTLGQGGAGCSVVVDGLYEGLDLNVQVSRPRFDMLCGPLFRTAKGMLEAEMKRLADAENGATFDTVLVAGNVSLMPGAAAVVDGLFPPASSAECWRGRTDVPSDEAVALGCAMHCGYLLRCRSDLGPVGGPCRDAPQTEDVPLCPVAIGVCQLDSTGAVDAKSAATLVGVGAPLPASVTRTVSLKSAPSGVLGMVKTALTTPVEAKLGLVQLPAKGDESEPRLLARIEDLPLDATEVEIALEITEEGKLTLAVNGGESVTL